MAIGAIDSISTNSDLASSRKSIAENFDTFLNLLTAQLKNQNPLDPLDTNQFTQQIVQFTSVEQQLKTNEYLEALSKSAQNASNTEAVSFIGKNITAEGANASLNNGSATWGYEASRSASDTTITIRDSLGNVVHSEEGNLNSGSGQYIWDGKDSSGNQFPEGSYSITINARDSNGNHVPVTTQITGLVTGVDLSGSDPILITAGAQVKLSSVTSVNANA